MSDGFNDDDIVRGLRRGQRDAWSALCEKYSSRLWTYLARLIGSDQEVVADVFQETLMAVARAGRDLQPQDNRLWSWLATIGHRQAALHWRKTYRRDEVHSALPVRSHDETLIEALGRRETATQVRRLLADMPADYTMLLAAKYFDGLSASEIVQQHGGTLEGVRSKLARARAEFRKRYAEIDSPSNTSR